MSYKSAFSQLKEAAMGLWQKTMIACARSAGLTKFMQDSGLFTGMSRRFVGGRTALEAVECAVRLQQDGISSSLFFLGEYVDDPALVEVNVAAALEMIPLLAEAGLDVQFSVDPTQIGWMISPEVCHDNLLRIGRTLKEQAHTPRSVLMLDMEDASVTEPTLEMHRLLRSENIPAAVTLQAYQHRSEDDLKALIAAGATVRLVKGAFAEPASIALTKGDDIDAAFLRFAEMLLSEEAVERGAFPVFGTHDHTMIEAVAGNAEKHGLGPEAYEIEMLYGVRDAYQRELVQEGVKLRLYLPFGKDWWPYSVRRIGENPKNALFVLRALGGR
jgi:proline dehydrogenase